MLYYSHMRMRIHETVHPVLLSGILLAWLLPWPSFLFAAPVDDELRLTVTPGAFELVAVEKEGREYRRIDAWGLAHSAPAGQPDLPYRLLWVGIPDNHAARARVLSAEYEDLPGPPPPPVPKDTLSGAPAVPLLIPFIDEESYRSGEMRPAELVSIGEPARIRHQRVVPVRVNLFRAAPGMGLLRVYTKIEIAITFQPEGRPSKERERTSAGEDPRWEGIYSSLLANYEEAKRFRTRPERGRAAPAKAFSGAEIKVFVDESGLYRFDHSELSDAGLAPGHPVDSFRFCRRGYSDDAFLAGEDPFTEKEIPAHAVDSDGDGFFGEGDALYAYLPGFREDRMERDFQDRFATEAVYFLAAGEEPLPIDATPAWKGYQGLTPLPSFPDSVRWEKDVFYGLSPTVDTTDLYFPFGKFDPRRLFTLDLPPPDTTQPFAVKAMTVSTVTQYSPTYHRYLFFDSTETDTLLNILVIREKPHRVKGERVWPGSMLHAGENTFIYHGMRGPNELTYADGAGGYPDWFEVHASFLYEAREDYARFSTGDSLGRVQMEIAGFTDSTILLFDVTDPHAPLRIAPDSVRNDGGTYTLVLQDSVGSCRVYAAATPAAARTLPAEKIVAAPWNDIAATEGSYVIITHEDFRDALEPFAAYRESKGFDVVVNDVSDVYDRFNGGVKDPAALRRYLRYAFERWSSPPVFALLVGDGYEDYKGIASNAEEGEFDFVPAYPIWERYLPSSSADRWTASDAWYVLLDGEDDYFPEILIGRFPVSDETELSAIIEKTIDYELYNLDAPWRRLTAFVADDAWTYSYGPIRNSYQDEFEEYSRLFAERITDDSEIRADTTGLFLSSFTDLFHELCPWQPYPEYPVNPNEADLDCVIEYSRDPENGITPAFFDLANGGAFLVNYQGHGSRTSLSHELFLVEGRDYRNKDHFDLADFSGPGSPPYIFMGYGCAISEFERFLSLSDDALGERMVQLAGTGAVLTYGSTAIEYLTPNLRLNEAVLAHFFPSPKGGVEHRGGSGTRSAADVLVRGMADYAAAYHGTDTARRYVILGDPALEIGPTLPPVMTVTVDGDTVSDGETRIPAAEGVPLDIEATVLGDVLIQENGFALHADGIPIPDTLYTIVPGVDSASNRWAWTIEHEHDAGGGAEEIVIRATDVWGRSVARTIRTSLDFSLLFDGEAHSEGDRIEPTAVMEIVLTGGFSLDGVPIGVQADGYEGAPDSVYAVDETTWVARVPLVLQEGETDLEIVIGGLRWTVPVTVKESRIDISVTVDGESVEPGHHLLGHRDGTPPEIAASIWSPLESPVEEIRLFDGEQPLPETEYEIVPDTVEGEPYYRLLFHPDIRNEEYDYRLEAVGGEGETAVFLLRASLPITLTIDGREVLDDDFAVSGSLVRAEAVYPGELPEAEILFELDGAPVPVDSFSLEGEETWRAVASIEAGGGSHDLLFRAGAFSASRRIRVEDRLRVVDLLAFPNPSSGESGIFYQLTLPADEVRAEIYTVAGRRIRTLSRLSSHVGYNENRGVWDGRDQDRDPVARGVYPFRVIAVRGGERAEAIGKFVVMDSSD